MSNFISISATNINRIRLGDTICMFKICKEVFENFGILFDFDELKNILLDISYINSFHNIKDFAEDIIKTISGKEIDINFEISDRLIKNFEENDKAVSDKLINIEMLKYLNEKLWPNILELIVKMAKDNIFGNISINVCIPYSNFLTIYDFKTCNNEVENIKRIILSSISDIIIWMMSNRIGILHYGDFILAENYLQFDVITYM